MSDDIYSPDETVEAAAVPSKPLADIPLEPFTPERFIAAQSMGLLWPAVVAVGPRGTLLYKGQVNDMIIVLWLCSLPANSAKPEDWTVKRALRQPGKAHDQSIIWAEEIGLSKPNSQDFWDGINRFEDIIIEINNAYTTPTGPAPPN